MKRFSRLIIALATALLTTPGPTRGQSLEGVEKPESNSILQGPRAHNAINSLPAEHRDNFTGRQKRLFEDTHRWMEERGLLVSVDLALMDQYASQVAYSSNNAASFAWQLFVEYELFEWTDVGSIHLGTTALGSVGLDYDESADSLSERTGSLSILNENIFPDNIALDQLYLQYLSPDADFFLSVGKIDMSDFFDDNRVANNSFTEFFAFTFQNSLSIPYPTYGEVGILTRWSITKDIYVMFGAGIAESEERVPIWGGLDGAWWELLESGITVRPDFLGVGTYRLTVWQGNIADNHGLGASISMDQDLGYDWLVGFLRLGIGNPNQTSISAALSGGFSILEPFGRPSDQVGLAFSWADSVDSVQDEKLFEFYYRLAIGDNLALSPDIQFLIDPAGEPDISLSVVAGLRLFCSL